MFGTTHLISGLNSCTCAVHLNIFSWLKTAEGCCTFKGGQSNSKVGQSKNIFNNYSCYPAYLYHTSTLWKICIAPQWRETKWRAKDTNRGGTMAERKRLEKSMCTLLTYSSLACGDVWVQCAVHKVHCVMCAVQTLTLMLDENFILNSCFFFESKPPTKHQHCSHHYKRLPKPAELNIHFPHLHLSHVTFESLVRWSKGFKMRRLCGVSLIGQKQ